MGSMMAVVVIASAVVCNMGYHTFVVALWMVPAVMMRI